MGQEPLPTETEFIEICDNDDDQTLETRLTQHSRAAVQKWLNTPIIDGDYPLHASARSNSVKTLRLLLAHGADPNQMKCTNVTPLFLAALDGHPLIVEQLLIHKADPNIPCHNDNTTPLYVAAQNNHPAIVTLLLENGADPNIARISDGVNSLPRNDGVTPLYIAAQNGHLLVVELLLNSGADPNLFRSQDGATPLYTASQNGHLPVVALLLNHQADFDHACDDGTTPFFAACQKNHQPVSELLLASNADINMVCRNGMGPLHGAIISGHTMMVVFLLKVGPISPVDNNSCTPLHYAAVNDCPVVVALLLQAGVDPSHQNSRGFTALSALLSDLKKQASPPTPRQNAIEQLLRGENMYGETPLHLAIRQGHAVSIASGSDDLETSRLDGCTPLHLAVLHGNMVAVAQLVIHGVNLSPLDLQNETPLQLALQGGHEAIINILGPAVITVSNEDIESEEVVQRRSVDRGLLSSLRVFSLQSWAASTVRRWFTLDEIRFFFASRILPPTLRAVILGIGCSAPDP